MLAAALAAAFPARAETLHARYSVSLIGLPLGTATIAGAFDSTKYRVEASAKLTGLITLVTNSKGAATSTGAFAGGRLLPASYATTSANAEMTRTVRMAMAGGAIQAVDISPPIEERPGRVPLTEGDLRGVIDPVSALLMTVPGEEPPVGPAACNRTLPIFDGATRFDVTLSFVGTRQVKSTGYEGPVAVCAARYTPIAGHRPDRKTTQFMAQNKQMEVWLVPVGNSRVVVPYRISVRTMVGTTVIEASEFRVDGVTKAAAVPQR